MIVDLAPPPMMSKEIFWLAWYVMLTRARSLVGLIILRLPPREAFEVAPPKYVIEEMSGLHKRHQNTLKSLKESSQICLGAWPQTCPLYGHNKI